MFRKRIIAIAILLTVLSYPVQAYASDYHENPDTAQEIYSGISLLQYYADSLDPVLEKDPKAIEAILKTVPLANIPPQLNQYITDFVNSSIAMSYSMAGMFQLWEQNRTLVKQYRLDEAAELNRQINDRLPQARSELAQLTLAVKNTGFFLKVNPAATGNLLSRTYNSVMEKIKRLAEMLDLLMLPVAESLKLDINPLTAFVGDEVSFNGILSYQGEPLEGRNIDILLNGTRYLSAITDTLGRFQGQFQVPYWYAPELEVQAIYYPRDDDRSTYLRATSPVVAIKVLYYAASLTIQTAGPAYPGKEAKVTGDFDYGQAYPIDRQGVEFYLDDVLISRFTAPETFTHNIYIEPGTASKGHTVTAVVPAEGRYAPVKASCNLDVIQAVTVLDFKAPAIGLIPGNLEVSGKLRSELGPLNKAAINLKMNRTQTRVISSSGGDFEASLELGVELSLIGSQTVIIKVEPGEPWNAPLSVTRNIFMVNIMNCGILLMVLLVIGFYLPRRFKKWFRGYTVQTPATEEAVPPLAPVYEMQAVTESSPLNEDGANQPGSIFDLYRLILKLVQTLTRVLLKPQQTLREYARENSRLLGPLSQYFIEFTLLIERFLYSARKPAREDVENSRRLYQTIKGGPE